MTINCQYPNLCRWYRQTFNIGSFFNTGHPPTFNLNHIEKLIQLHEEKIALYERMLKEKDEMMARLEKLLKPD